MGTEIDRLEVQVEAQATKANNQLDKLVGKLDALSSSLTNLNSSGLTGLSDGVAKFAKASSQLSNVKTTDFTRLTKNIDKLANLNTQQIYSASSAIVTLSNAVNSLGSVSANSMQVVDVANSIGKLGSASVQKAITNLPALATAMNDLMTTLSKAPSVNRNIIDMTNSLANLATQGAKVGTAGTSLTKSVNGVGTAMRTNTPKVSKFASAIGKIYQRYFMVFRAVSKLWTSIEGSMDYVEILNYFDAAFGQVAESAVSQWEDAGYSSADAYYESFSSRAKELTSKMTGFSVNDNGTLTATGNASLGINPTQLMNYQATFAQISSSMGVTAETSLMLSQALTEIGADLASVKNMDFDKVWTDMASGLVGMSRTLDKYGVNIRSVNLQQKLFDLGIEENITNLNQNDKALLRAIILLDSTKYAWGDLADTLNQPANQLRLLSSNFANLSRTIGNLFLPMVSNLLPYVNGLVIALQRLFTWVGNLVGIDLSTITSSIGNSAVDLGDLLDEADGASDALGSAAENAKKLKTATMGIDELNINAPQNDSDSGSGSVSGLPSGLLDSAFEKAFSEYQKAWDEAFKNIENRANNFADKIEKYLQPIRDIIEDFAIGDFFKAGQDTSNLVAGIFNLFADAIDKIDWEAIGNGIGDYLNGIDWSAVLSSVGNFIWQAINAAMELWKGSFDAAPIETGIITAISLLKWSGLGKAFSKSILKAAASLDFIGIFSKILYVSPEMLSHLFVVLEDQYFRGTWLDTDTWTGIFADVNNAITDFINGFGDIFITSLFDAFINTISTNGELYDAAGFFFSKIGDDFKKKDWWAIGEDILGGILSGLTGALYTIASPFILLFNWIYEGVCKVCGINSPAKNMMPLGEYILLGIVEGFSNTISTFTEAITSWFDTSVEPWFAKEKWMGIFSGIKTALSTKWTEIKTWWDGNALAKWWTDSVEPWFTDEKWNDMLSNIPVAFKEAFKNAANGAIGFLNGVIDGIEDLVNNTISGLSGIGDLINSIPGVDIEFNTPSITLPRIPAFSIGGFPEDGLFYANHNELIGQFSDGRAVVANNEQIVEGISYGVESAVERVLTPYLQQIAQNTRETADKDMSVNIGDRDIARANMRGKKAMGLRIRIT